MIMIWLFLGVVIVNLQCANDLALVCFSSFIGEQYFQDRQKKTQTRMRRYGVGVDITKTITYKTWG